MEKNQEFDIVEYQNGKDQGIEDARRQYLYNELAKSLSWKTGYVEGYRKEQIRLQTEGLTEQNFANYTNSLETNPKSR